MAAPAMKTALCFLMHPAALRSHPPLPLLSSACLQIIAAFQLWVHSSFKTAGQNGPDLETKFKRTVQATCAACGQEAP